MASSKLTTQEVAEILGINISDFRRMIGKEKSRRQPYFFDSSTNSVGWMWSEGDIEQARIAMISANC